MKLRPGRQQESNLFDAAADGRRDDIPLAERMRPRTLEAVAGQDHLTGHDGFLARAVASGTLPSLILWGPPGTGKTTIASLLAASAGYQLITLSAVNAGVAEIRAAVQDAADRRRYHQQRTLLFIDEIHRFNKGQQDALLPHVERGTVTLAGATTENPSFYVNGALLSRARVLVLNPLTPEAIRMLIERALADEANGLGTWGVTLSPEGLDALVQLAGGDGRRALNALETAARFARGRKNPVIGPEEARFAAQKQSLLYDKSGEEHYNTISAFIKSMRGSDPDAAIYYMVRMLEAGEDPLFLIRRMVIFAAEDIGNADPRALTLAVSTLQAFEFVGMPEGVLPMSQCAAFLATAPKSNTTIASYKAAREIVKEHGALPVPKHLRNAPTSLMKDLGYGAGYKYPHNYSGHYVKENYLPDPLQPGCIYQPSESGEEQAIRRRMAGLQSPPPEEQPGTGED